MIGVFDLAENLSFADHQRIQKMCIRDSPYPSVYALCVAKAGMEKASGARPPIAGELPDIGNYTKIAVGFPIWWFSCPMIIHSFLAKLDLKDKKVYLFCTSKSSGPKNSAQDIRDKPVSYTHLSGDLWQTVAL